MLKKSIVICTAVILLAVSCLSQPIFAEQITDTFDEIVTCREAVCMDSLVSWHEHYESDEEMMHASDIAFTGTVVSVSPELRKDLVFTNVYVSVDSVIFGNIKEGDVIRLLQTGGRIDKLFTPAPTEIPVLEVGVQYELFLQSNENDNRYGQYYLITGGYQGVLEIDENDVYTLSENDAGDEETDNNSVFASAQVQRGWTPTASSYWHKTILYVYVNSSIASEYSASIDTAIRAGINSWPTYSNAPSVIYVSSYSSADVFANMGDYGSTGWDGLTVTTYSGTVNSHSDIKINTRYLYDDYSSLSGLWQAIACHEFGHSLGLLHNTSVSQSIMRSMTVSYYNYNPNGTPRWTTPQSADIYSINTLY